MKGSILITMLLAVMHTLTAANTTTTVSQVTTAVTVSDDVDYVISSTSPFSGSGSVNIANTEHAVVIIQNVRASEVISNWLSGRVYVNGAQAVNGSNCEVRMYAQGAIVLPYTAADQPLTVYSGQNFSGTSCSDFGLENTGGYMNTLTDEKLNNQIRSFKLKRGYMVTFSTRASGRGYSRCFIADKADLEVSTLPTVLDQTITSYRVFRWYNASKKGLASNGSYEANQALHTSWCYDWAQGNASNLPDCEWVPNHIYEDWPSSATCGSVTGSCHMKANNEPANTSDDTPQSVETILANWENLMRTGMRLCTPSSWDGSDYWNGTGKVIKVFLDSIDARGWRCDIVDAHCYWPEGNFSHLQNYWWPNYKRPIWVSEWIWGASWNQNGAFANGVSDATILSTTKNILNNLNSMGCVERYAYWNSESKGHIYENGALTELGEYYASMNTGLGYNAAYEFIPTNPRMYDPSNLTARYDSQTQQVTLSWHEVNGEYNQLMVVQERKLGSYSWTNVDTIALQETEADYTATVSGMDGNRYRIRVVDVDGEERLTNEAYAVIENLQYGDGVSVMVDGEAQTRYLGGNMFINGDFVIDTVGWTNGVGGALTYPYFQVVPRGGVDDSPYLQCYGDNSALKHAQSVNQMVKLSAGGSYYASMAGMHCNSYQRIGTSTRTDALGTLVKVSISDVTTWTEQGTSFTVSNDTCLFAQVRSAAGTAQIDNVRACRLFCTADSALADALVWELLRVQAFVDYYRAQAPQLMAQLEQYMSVTTDANLLEDSLQQCYQSMLAARTEVTRQALTTDLERALPFAADAEHYIEVSDCLSNPNFASQSGWTVKSGTYTGGDQRLATQAGLTCWNAWWSNAVSGDDRPTLSIQQTTSKLAHGLYALECKATTQHLCETDQHGWIYNAVTGDTLSTDTLALGVLDLPAFADADKWQTLTSSYLYVQQDSVLTVGFTGSKTSADNGRFISYANPTATPDNREGWWCATDFVLRRIPVLRVEVDSTGWGTLCMPSPFTVPEGVTFYTPLGILADGTAICLTPAESPQPGYPYLFHSAVADTVLSFYEDVSTTTSAKTNVNGFRGVLVASITLNYPVGSFRFVDGKYQIITASGTHVDSYSAMIYKQKNLPVYDSWDGLTVPIVGAASGVEQLTADDAEDASACDLLGRPAPSRGLMVRQGRVVFVR